jgi:hypothetical protein
VKKTLTQGRTTTPNTFAYDGATCVWENASGSIRYHLPGVGYYDTGNLHNFYYLDGINGSTLAVTYEPLV